MGLEIGKIANEALKVLAQKADVVDSENDYLDEAEVSVFKKLVENALKSENAGFTGEDYGNVVNLMTVPNKQVQLNNQEKVAVFVNKINSLAKEGMSRNEILESIKKEFGNYSDYKDTIKKFETLLNAMNTGKNRKGEDVKLEYNQYSDIQDNRKEVKRAMEKAGMDTEEWHEVRKTLEQAVVNELKEKADNDVALMIANLMAEDPKLTFKDALNKAKKYFTKETVYRDENGLLIGVHAFKGAGKKNKVTYDKVYAQAFKDASIPKKQKAFELVQAEFAKYYNTNALDQRKLRENIYKDLKTQHPELKEYFWSALFGNSLVNRVSGESSQGKLMAQSVTNYNKVQRKVIQTEEEFLDALGSKREHIYTAMKTMMTDKLNQDGLPVDNNGNVINAKGQAIDSEGNVLYNNAKPARVPLISTTEDGKLDLTQLSLLIANEVGRGDHELSKHANIDKNTSEINRTKGKLATIKDDKGNTLEDLLKNGNLTDKDTKKIIKALGFPVEKTDYYAVILGGILGGLAGAANGAAAAALNNRQVLETGKKSYDYTAEIKVTNLTQAQIDEINGYKGVATTLVNSQTVIKIAKFIEFPSETIKLSKMISDTALKSAILPAITGALAALAESEGEFEVTGALPSEDNIDDYAVRMKKENPEYADILIAIATTFVKDGEWLKEDFSKFIDNHRGTDGKLNKKEFLNLGIALKAMIKETVDNEEYCQDTPCNATISKGEKEPDTTRTLKSLPRKTQKGDSWKGLIDAYYPCLLKECNGQYYGKNGAIRKLKEALAGDDKDMLHKLVYVDTDLPAVINLPPMIGNCYREDGTVKPIDTSLQEGQTYTPSSYKEIGGNVEIIETIAEGRQVWVAKDDCTKQTGRGYTKQEALDDLKDKTKKEYANETEIVK